MKSLWAKMNSKKLARVNLDQIKSPQHLNRRNSSLSNRRLRRSLQRLKNWLKQTAKNHLMLEMTTTRFLVLSSQSMESISKRRPWASLQAQFTVARVGNLSDHNSHITGQARKFRSETVSSEKTLAREISLETMEISDRLLAHSS